jgi:DNA polymerase III alpha subunit (gram-positive type)
LGSHSPNSYADYFFPQAHATAYLHQIFAQT